MSNAAIFYHPDGYVTDRADLKGRHVAGESFLNGFFRHATVSEFACHAAHPDHARLFAEEAARAGAVGRPVRFYPLDTPAALAEIGCLHVPDPRIDRFAWRRRAGDQRGYSLCGVTHTTSESPESFIELVNAPIQPWDAVICTSRAARASVEAVLLPHAEYLRDRFGANPILPNLPIIPLGIDASAFDFPPDVRAAERAKLGAGGDDLIVLFMGRLSFHAKAHPLAMYLALDRAARTTRRRIRLVQAGWFANDAIARAFIDGARRHCPSVEHVFLDGRKPEVRERIWAAADVFVSLVDNIQETFGITPVEAMAAGLPGVVADWNGYRDTVRHGIDGFRVPTMTPPPGGAAEIADRHALGLDDYDHYIGRYSQATAVDVEASARAFATLFADDDLRRRMGATARDRARAEFDWSAIVPRYREMWGNLAELRRTAPESAPMRPNRDPNPGRPDPSRMFAAYPTRVLSSDLTLNRAGNTADTVLAAAEALWSEGMNSPLQVAFASPDEMSVVLRAMNPPGRRVDELLALAPSERRAAVGRSLVNLLKYDLIRAL